MRMHVGTSGWNYTEWRGSFYPEGMKPAAMLPYYAGRFSTVEVNNTFYRMPTTKVVEGWAAAVPEAFTFVLKAPQRITHFARLRDVDDPGRFFCDTARTLGPKLGPLLFQLPPNFKVDTGRLADLLALLPPDVRAAFEFRNATWFTDEVYTRLAARNAALCVADNDEGATPAVATADWGYLRLRVPRAMPTTTCAGGWRRCAAWASAGATPSSSSSTSTRAPALPWPRGSHR